MTEQKQLTFRRIFYTITFSLCLLVLYPFINGSGCDFTYEVNTDNFHSKGRCQAGVFSSIQYEKKTGRIFKSTMLFGYVSNKAITVRYDFSPLYGWDEQLIKGQPSLHDVIDDLYRDMRVRVSYMEKVEPDMYVVLSRTPTPLSFIATIHGDMSFW
ncbi:hypothetical protein ACB035_10435 [Aeromonas sp. S12(2024)]|uniref:hypothetical protein n=1 Tax=Aeromonas sp. S12(2024) TaxID=3242885 RepID=UPI003527BE0F